VTRPLPTITPLGESAVTLSWGTTVSPDLNVLVHRTARSIHAARLPQVVDVVPAYAALTVFYDPLHLDYEAMAARLGEIAAAAGDPDPASDSRTDHEIPVVYDGPDLEEVARQTGLRIPEIVARHSAREYQVYLLGFVPGFAYLGELDPALVVPRHGSPRKRIPAGSVAIAGAQTAVYPLDTPGGWHLIGHTPVTLFDPTRTPAALLAPGDRVRFVVAAP